VARQSSDGCASTIVGDRSLTEQGKRSFYFDIKITDETNTKDDKARHIREAFDGFAGILGNLYELSCIQVQDVRATSCGYGGIPRNTGITADSACQVIPIRRTP